MNAVGDNLAHFAITFVKNMDKRTTEIHVQCDKGISIEERVGMLERLKTEILLENVFGGILNEKDESESADDEKVNPHK